jgi:hypothetical protein
MFTIGQTVRVLHPFAESFPATYTITEVVQSADDTTAYILGELGGFDAVYLEAAA